MDAIFVNDKAYYYRSMELIWSNKNQTKTKL